MKKIVIVLFAILALALILSGCDQLAEWQGNATITGQAKYFDKADGNHGGISVSLLSADIVIKPNQIPLDLAPLTKITSGSGEFEFADIAPGQYIVVAEDPNGEYQPANVVITVAQDQSVVTENLTLTKAVQHVVIFRDTTPLNVYNRPGSEWENISAIGDILEDEVGMTLGSGVNQYEYKTSSQMASYTPALGDLVIIGGDQTTSFYTTYTTNKSKFDDFVADGGSMYWIACDMGWQSGDFTSSLPGGVTWRDANEYENDIVYFEHPITKNFPLQMEGNFASHGGFNNLGTLSASIFNVMTYVVETNGGLPTYVEYRSGYGKVLATTTPLEYYVTNGSTTMPTGFQTNYKDLFKLMLVRSVKYMMNIEVSEDVPPSAGALGLRSLAPTRASH